jgi:hypothetical protein
MVRGLPLVLLSVLEKWLRLVRCPPDDFQFSYASKPDVLLISICVSSVNIVIKLRVG